MERLKRTSGALQCGASQPAWKRTHAAGWPTRWKSSGGRRRQRVINASSTTRDDLDEMIADPPGHQKAEEGKKAEEGRVPLPLQV